MREAMLSDFHAEKQEALLFQVAGLAAKLASDTASYRSEELARMARVMWSFRAYGVFELLILAAGVVLTAWFPGRQSLHAIGVGLVIQASVLLVLDLFAAQRGRAYLDAIARLG